MPAPMCHYSPYLTRLAPIASQRLTALGGHDGHITHPDGAELCGNSAAR